MYEVIKSMESYNGNTFVAYIDVSGFKEMMRQEEKAVSNLDEFYNASYDFIKEQQNTNNPRIDGIFISDSGILFVRNYINEIMRLEALLSIIKKINNRMLKADVMLTTSIAYGPFEYQDRIELKGIKKNFLVGNAYIWAYFDNEHGDLKIQPGECRILKRNLPNCIKTARENTNSDILKMIGEKQGDNKHYYYYWMREDPSEIKEFERKYYDAYNSQFTEILKVLKEKTRRV